MSKTDKPLNSLLRVRGGDASCALSISGVLVSWGSCSCANQTTTPHKMGEEVACDIREYFLCVMEHGNHQAVKKICKRVTTSWYSRSDDQGTV